MRRREFITVLSAAATWPLAASAQAALPIVGFMSARAPDESANFVATFRQGLADTCRVLGQRSSGCRKQRG
jgi:putative tryptophan/tyrosine transport system substrate-binding protein